MKTCSILIQFNPFIILSQSHFNRLDTICMEGILSTDCTAGLASLTCLDCPTCIQICEGSTMPYSDHTCPQCGKDAAEYMDLF